MPHFLLLENGDNENKGDATQFAVQSKCCNAHKVEQCSHGGRLTGLGPVFPLTQASADFLGLSGGNMGLLIPPEGITLARGTLHVAVRMPLALSNNQEHPPTVLGLGNSVASAANFWGSDSDSAIC